jgi:hypothetical protein
MTLEQKHSNYQQLVEKIGERYQSAQGNIVSAVNTQMLYAYWEIGKYIVEYEQGGNYKAEYGTGLLENLSHDLSIMYGRGFSRSNLTNMRQLYIKYPICVTLSHKLTWSHYYELLKIEDDLARSFYEKQAIIENWGIRELRRQKKTGLFHRLAIGKDKEKVLELAKEGQIVKSEEDFIRNPHVFEFLNFPEDYQYTESDIEKAITKEVNEESDNEPIGLILSEEKDEIMVEYAMLNDSSKLIVSKYRLYLPDTEELKRKVREILEK